MAIKFGFTVEEDYKSGLYALICTVEGSSCYGMIYIGQTTDTNRRFGDHLNDLKNNNHKNPKLINYWTKYSPVYGDKCLDYIVLFHCHPSLLNFYEKKLIANLDTIKNGMNCMTGGVDPVNPSLCRPCIMKHADTDEVVTSESIRAFARKFDLNFSCVRRVCNGLSTNANGWYCMTQDWRPKYYYIVDPNNKIWRLWKPTEFARKHRLKVSSFYNVLQGKMVETDGWKLIDQPSPKGQKYYKLLDPNRNIIEGFNIEKLSRQFRLHSQRLGQLISGKIKTYRGWRNAIDIEQLSERTIYDPISV